MPKGNNHHNAIVQIGLCFVSLSKVSSLAAFQMKLAIGKSHWAPIYSIVIFKESKSGNSFEHE